jgi:type II secretory pathway pseudopilin PulG
MRGTKAHRHEGTKGDGPCGIPAPSPSPFRSCLRHPRGFTLTEVLIIIGIIVLLMALAVPAFNVITGARSIDGAQNNVSAFLGRARQEAMALQQVAGVMFYLDRATQNPAMALVYATERLGTDTSPPEVMLDVIADTEAVQLPRGIGLQAIDDASVDRYLGFNIASDAGVDPPVRYGGVILFDGRGHLLSISYGFRCTYAGTGQTAMGRLLQRTTNLVPPTSAAGPLRSQLGFVLFDAVPFRDLGFSQGDPQMGGTPPAGSPSETEEELWIDQNARFLLVNRYNGTMIRGE